MFTQCIGKESEKLGLNFPSLINLIRFLPFLVNIETIAFACNLQDWKIRNWSEIDFLITLCNQICLGHPCEDLLQKSVYLQ